MQKSSHVLSVICIVLVLVVLGALKKIESKIDVIEQQVADQGKVIAQLSPVANIKTDSFGIDKIEENVDIQIGKPFPKLEFKDLNGKTVNLRDYRGKVVLIDFWATWCGPCTKETPNLLAAYEAFKDKGLEIIGISLDKERQSLTDYLETHHIPWPNYFDGKGWNNEISSKLDIHSIPAIVLLDKEGIVRETTLRGDRIREAVAALLGLNIRRHIDPKDWKEEYVIELKAVDDITMPQFGVNWFRPHVPLNISTEKPDFIKTLPSFRYDMQRYLTFRLGDAEDNCIYAVADFRTPQQNHFSFDLYLDRNRDGDLTGDFIQDQARITGIEVPYNDGTTEPYSLYLYSYSNDDKALGFAYQCKAGRYGSIDVGQVQIPLLVIDHTGDGIFNDSQDVLLMDWDLDGRINGSHQADEDVPLYSLLELPGATYQVARLDSPGRRMILKLIDKKEQTAQVVNLPSENPFRERIHSVYWEGQQDEMAFEGVQHVFEKKLGVIDKWVDGLSFEPDGRIAFSCGNGTTPDMMIAYWSPSGTGESVVDIQYTRRSENTDDGKSEENGYFCFFSGPLAFDSKGTCYFSLGSCSPNGLYKVVSNNPVQIEKLYSMDSTRSLQAPLFDDEHLYSTSWNGIFRYPIASQQKPNRPWFSVQGEKILLLDCLIVDSNKIIASILFKTPKASSEKDHYIKSFVFDKINKSFRVLTIDEIGPMAISWDGQKMIHFNNINRTIDEFALINE